MKQNTESHVSLGLAEALTLLFIALKLTGCIGWHWIWVISPIWITLLIVGVIGIAVFALTVIQEHLKNRRNN